MRVGTKLLLLLKRFMREERTEVLDLLLEGVLEEHKAVEAWWYVDDDEARTKLLEELASEGIFNAKQYQRDYFGPFETVYELNCRD